MSSSKKILVLKTGEALPAVKAVRGDFEDWIAQGLHGSPDASEITVASVYAGEPLPPAESLGGVVVTGSPLMVTELAEWSEAAARWLDPIVEGDEIPVLGLCYGHQLMAHARGGKVGVNPKGREMGTVEVTFLETGDAGSARPLGPLFEQRSFPSHMSHLESVLIPPSDATVLATTGLESHAVLQFGPRQWGVQFHPEFDRDIMQRYVAARRDILIGEGFDPDGMIASATDTPEAHRTLSRFRALVESV